MLHPFASAAMFPPLIDMSTTQTLLAMVRTAKEAELQVRPLRIFTENHWSYLVFLILDPMLKVGNFLSYLYSADLNSSHRDNF